jgi:aquaporin Z
VGVTPIKLGPGSYWYQKGKKTHTTVCLSKTPCEIFIVQNEKFDAQEHPKRGIDMTLRLSLSDHWPEYLIEGWALGCFMIAVALLVTIFDSPNSPVYEGIPSARLRIALLAGAIGMSLTLVIQSPWGKRSGAHMNPAITLAFLRLRKIQPWDALFYVLAQISGGTLGVAFIAVLIGKRFTDPPVHYAVTVPGTDGEAVAFLAETVISFALMATILTFTTSPRLIRFTALAIGCLVALLIIVEAPVSGASMNPARTLASAIPAMRWQGMWIYLLGPTFGMLIAAQLHSHTRGHNALGCAKMLHPREFPCIHCGYRPDSTGGAVVQVAGGNGPKPRS